MIVIDGSLSSGSSPAKSDRIIRLHYVSGPKSLHIAIGDVVFWVDGVEKIFRHKIYGEILAMLAMASPNTVTAEDIFDRIQKVASLGSRLNLENTVQKYIHGLRQDLALAGLKMDVLKNIRSVGYRLAEGWKAESTRSTKTIASEELYEIRNLVNRCIEHVDSRRIEINAGGLMYLDRDSGFATENMVLLDRISWQLIHSLSEPELIPDILDIKRDLYTLMSYAIFSRVGHRLNEVEWRQDYRQEIRKIYRDIEMRVQKVMTFSHFEI